MDLFFLAACLSVSCLLGHGLFSARGFESLRTDLLEHLALLTSRGLPLAPGLLALAEERSPAGRLPLLSRRRREARTLERIAAGLQSHGSLAEALAENPGLVGRDQLELVRLAESRGSLPAVLDLLSEEESARERALWRALEVGLYALVLTVFVLLITVFLTSVIMPKFRAIEESIGIAHGVGRELAQGVTLAYLVLCVGAACFLLPGRLGRWLRWHGARVLAAVPGVGRPLRRWRLARWLQRVAALLQQGATLPEALEHVAGAPGSTPGQVEAARFAREGRPLGEVLEVALGVDAPALAPSLLLTVDRAGSLARGWSDAADRLAARAGRRLVTWGEALRPLPVLACATVVAAQYVTLWLTVLSVEGAVIGSVW